MSKSKAVWIARDNTIEGEYVLFRTSTEPENCGNGEWVAGFCISPDEIFCAAGFHSITGFHLRKGRKAKVRIHIERVENE